MELNFFKEKYQLRNFKKRKLNESEVNKNKKASLSSIRTNVTDFSLTNSNTITNLNTTTNSNTITNSNTTTNSNTRTVNNVNIGNTSNLTIMKPIPKYLPNLTSNKVSLDSKTAPNSQNSSSERVNLKSSTDSNKSSKENDSPHVSRHKLSQLKLHIQNDYSQHFIDTGERPQNFIRDTSVEDRYFEYEKKTLIIQFCSLKKNIYYSILFTQKNHF